MRWRPPKGAAIERKAPPAALDFDEQVALRRVALGSRHVKPALIARLRDLHLIEPEKSAWRLTALGQREYKSMSRPVAIATASASDEIERILDKFAKQRLP